MVLAISPSLAAGHSPLFPEGNHSLEAAKVIERPAKSIAIYHHLEAAEASYYSFDLKAGDRIYLQLLAPESPMSSGFLPGLALMGPSLGTNDARPHFLEVPEGYDVLVVPGEGDASGELEPFTPGPVFFLATIDVLAPSDGTYYAAVFAGDLGGRYAIAIGHSEEFTAVEILSLPADLISIYLWEGQTLLQAMLPYVLVMATGALMAVHVYRRTGMPSSPAKWMALGSSLAFLGSCASVLYQLLFAFTVVDPSPAVALGLMFALLYLALSVAMARFAFRGRRGITVWSRLSLIVIALLGVGLWGGLYLGPLLAMVAAVLPSDFQ